jgi:putative serine protease PepD
VLGVQVTDSPDGGALVGDVTAGSPAADAGVKSGDVVTAVGDVTVSSAESLTGQVRAREVGDTVTLTIRRGGSETTLDVTLEASS